jgi:SET domain-containing protein
MENCGYSTNNVLALLSDWPFGDWARSVRDKANQARGLYRGRRISTEEADRREARGARYQFELNKRWTIDGSPRWNLARYINHSCRPNAKPVGRRGGIVIVAVRRIEPGEEITYDYGREYLKHFLENGGCRCAACRRKRILRRRRTRRRERTK